MKTFVALFCLSVMLFAMVLPLHAQDKPIQISLLDPVQIFDDQKSITGLKINLLYGKNVNVTGLDVGFIASKTTGNFTGIQFGHIVGMIDGNGTGIQWDLVHLDKGQFTGLQYGFYNSTNHMIGLDLGFINVADKMTGLQLGLVNIIHHGGLLPFFPVFNVGLAGK